MSKVKDFLLRELAAVAFVTAYFLSWFVVVGVLKSLMLAQYNISYAAMSGAVIGALVLAKVVVVLDETKAGERFSERAALSHILYRSLIYTLVVLLVLLAEKVVEAMFDGATLMAAFDHAWEHSNRNHVITTTMLIGISLIFYNTFSVVNRALGDGGLMRVLRSPQTAAESE